LKRTLDIVTSVLNEELCIGELHSRIKATLTKHPDFNWRLIICDNGSTDSSWQIIKNLSELHPNIIGIRMSRTFPLDAAFTCGIDLARADALVIMASDLQDPPEVIDDFIIKFKEGFEQVVAKVVKRESVPFLRRQLSNLFYLIANKATNNLIPKGVSDFRLLSKSAYEGARGLREKNRFLRGLIAWTGFKTAVIEIERPPRFKGESKFVSIKLGKVISWSINAILSHTSKPLVLISFLGIIFSVLSFGSTLFFILFWFTKGVPFAGFGTLVSLIILGFSFTLLSVGILGQYIALIYEEVKDRPIYIVAEKTE
jgi:glycosyltransferase involved in cell wall biosynthesis